MSESIVNDSIKVSIIITCYNLESFIKEAIDSLLNQSCDFRYEIIVIDDASTDSSCKVLSGIEDKRVKLIALNKNGGAAQAINIAFSHVRGQYVCRFDGDDKWYPDYLKKAVDILDQHPEVVLVHTDVSFIDEHSNITSARKNIVRPAHLGPVDHEFESILERYYINAPAIMARKESWDRVLPWQEQFRTGLGDWFCTLSMLEKNVSYFINEPLAYYRIHSSNMHRAMIKDRSAEKNTLWILDHFKKRDNGIGSTTWNRIYFEQNRQLGFAYFFHGMDKDAKRCLTRAFRYNPKAIVRMEFTRIWLASFVGKNTYTRVKQILRKVTGK